MSAAGLRGYAVALTAAAGIGTASASTYYHPHPAITDPAGNAKGFLGLKVAQADVLSGDITTNGTTVTFTTTAAIDQTNGQYDLTGFCENANDYESDFFDQITDGTATLSLGGDGDGDYNGTLTAPAVYNTAAGTESATFNLAAINTTAGEPSSDVFEPSSELAVSAYAYAYEPGFFGASNGTETFDFTSAGNRYARLAGHTACPAGRLQALLDQAW